MLRPDLVFFSKPIKLFAHFINDLFPFTGNLTIKGLKATAQKFNHFLLADSLRVSPCRSNFIMRLTEQSF